MAVLQGCTYNPHLDTYAVQVTADLAAAKVVKISDASLSPCLVVIGTAGCVPYGVSEATIDYSVDGGRTTVIRNGYVKMTCAAAITDASIPVKAGASGNITPCDTDKDVIVGYPIHTAANGDAALIDLKLMGSFYTV